MKRKEVDIKRALDASMEKVTSSAERIKRPIALLESMKKEPFYPELKNEREKEKPEHNHGSPTS